MATKNESGPARPNPASPRPGARTGQPSRPQVGFGVRVGRWLKRFVREWTPVVVAVLLIRSFIVESFVVPTGSMLETIYVGDAMLVNKFIYGIKLPFTDRVVIPVSNPRRGDVIVFRFPGDSAEPADPRSPRRYVRLLAPLLPLYWDRQAGFFKWYTPNTYVKRCVAVAGDTVEYRGKQLYVNGRLQNEPYVIHSDMQTLTGPRVPPEEFQQAWVQRRFFRSPWSRGVRDSFGPVVIPPGHVMAMGDNRDNSEDSRFWGPLELRHVKGRPLVTYFSSSAATNPPSFLKVILSPWAIRLGRIGRTVR